jgi:chemotaxis protein MotC
LAKAAASEVLALKPDSAEDRGKALLYEAAADAPTIRAQDALETLQEIKDDRLSDEDMEIHQAADGIARAVSGKAPKMAAVQSLPGTSATSGKPTSNPLRLPHVAIVIEHADATLKEADLLISGNDK